MRHVLSTSVLAALVVLALGSPALSQEPGTARVDFVVSPAKIDVRLSPGESVEIPIQVTNRSPDTLELLTYVEAIEIPPGDLVTVDELAFTAARWTRFAEPVLVIPGESQATATLRIDVPDDVPDGGYHAFAFLQSQAVTSDGTIIQSGRIGSTVLLDVFAFGEDAVRAARVADMSLDVSWDGLFSPRVDATTTVVNIGDTNVVVGGLHTLRSFPGSETTDVELGPFNLLRGTQHTFVSSFTSVPFIGRATITSEIVYQVGPDDLPVILIQRSIWVIPWRIIGFLALIGLLAGLIFWRRRQSTPPSPDLNSTNKETSWLELEPPELVP
jgi:hypothetical protein